MEIGTASVRRGQKRTGYLKVAELCDGSPVNVPILVVNGSNSGPSLWIQCCIHGNEVAGPYALLQAIKELDPNKMKGALIGVPALNITGFWASERMPIFDTKDLNRVMPGDPEGGFTEQCADVIHKNVKANADSLVDVHWAGAVDWALYNADVEIADKCRKLAESSAFDVIVSNGNDGLLNGALFNVIAREGIPSVILESKDIAKLHVAFVNMLKFLGIVEGRPSAPKSQVLYKGFAWKEIVTKRGGLFYPKVEEGSTVHKGQTLGIITDLFGDEVEKISSPVEGLVMLAPGHVPLKSGDSPFEICDKSLTTYQSSSGFVDTQYSTDN